MSELVKKSQGKWEENRSALKVECSTHSLYYFPAHFQHLSSIIVQEGFMLLGDTVKKQFLNHLNEICFNILWNYQKPTPIFFQFWDKYHYWIGFSGYTEHLPEITSKKGYWNISVTDNIYWCELVASNEYKLQKNKIDQIPQTVINNIHWDEGNNNQSKVAASESNVDSLAEYVFRNKNPIETESLQSQYVFFNETRSVFPSTQVTKEEFKAWYEALPEDDQQLLAIEVMGKKIGDPRELDPDFVRRLYSENTNLKSKQVQVLQENAILETKLKLAESKDINKDEEKVKLEKQITLLKSDNEYLKMRIKSLVSTIKKLEENSSTTDTSKFQLTNEKLQRKYELSLQTISSLEEKLFHLEVEKAQYQNMVTLNVKIAPLDAQTLATSISTDLNPVPLEGPVVEVDSQQYQPQEGQELKEVPGQEDGVHPELTTKKSA